MIEEKNEKKRKNKVKVNKFSLSVFSMVNQI